MNFKRLLKVVSLLLVASDVRAAPVLLSEVLYDATGADDGQLFVELFGPAGLGLEGFVIEGVNGANGSIGPVLALAGAIPLDGLFVVADGAAGATSVPDADLVLDFDLQNGPDSIVLRDAAGAVQDALGYGVFGVDEVFAGEGTPAPDPGPGYSLARRFADVDTGDNAADFIALEVPTPGVAPTAVPEPSPALMLAAACLALAAVRRR